MLTAEQLARRAAKEEGPDSVVIRAERVSSAGDVVCQGTAASQLEGAEWVVAVMEHVNGNGRPRLVASCEGEPSARGVIQRVVTDLCVIDRTERGWVVREVAPGVSAREVQGRTGVALLAGPELTVIEA